MLFDTVTRRGVVCFVPDSGHVCGCTCLLCVCVCLYASTCVCERPDRLFPLHPATLSPHCHLLLTRGDLSSIMAHFDIARAPTMSSSRLQPQSPQPPLPSHTLQQLQTQAQLQTWKTVTQSPHQPSTQEHRLLASMFTSLYFD